MSGTLLRWGFVGATHRAVPSALDEEEEPCLTRKSGQTHGATEPRFLCLALRIYGMWTTTTIIAAYRAWLEIENISLWATAVVCVRRKFHLFERFMLILLVFLAVVRTTWMTTRSSMPWTRPYPRSTLPPTTRQICGGCSRPSCTAAKSGTGVIRIDNEPTVNVEGGCRSLSSRREPRPRFSRLSVAAAAANVSLEVGMLLSAYNIKATYISCYCLENPSQDFGRDCWRQGWRQNPRKNDTTFGSKAAFPENESVSVQ